MIIGLIAAAVLVLLIAGRFFGDFFPFLIFFGAVAFDLFIVPRFPGSPIACMRHHDDPCTGKTTWLMGLLIVVPLCLMQLYKELRGDTRGKKGTWG